MFIFSTLPACGIQFCIECHEEEGGHGEDSHGECTKCLPRHTHLYHHEEGECLYGFLAEVLEVAEEQEEEVEEEEKEKNKSRVDCESLDGYMYSLRQHGEPGNLETRGTWENSRVESSIMLRSQIATTNCVVISHISFSSVGISLPIVSVAVITFFVIMSFIAHKRYPHIGETGQKRHRNKPRYNELVYSCSVQRKYISPP